MLQVFCHVFYMIREKERVVIWQSSDQFNLNSSYSIKQVFSEQFEIVTFVYPVIKQNFIYLTDLNIEDLTSSKIQVQINYSIDYDVIQVSSQIDNRSIRPRAIQVQINQTQELHLKAVKVAVKVKLINRLQKTYYSLLTTQDDNQITYQFSSDLFTRLVPGMRQIWLEIYYQVTPDEKISEVMHLNEIELSDFKDFVGTSEITLFPNAVNIKTTKLSNFEKFYKELLSANYKEIFIRLIINIKKDDIFLQLSRIFEFSVPVQKFQSGEISCYCSEMIDPQSCYLYTNSLQYITESSFYGFVTFQFKSKAESRIIISLKEIILNYCGINANLILKQNKLSIEVKTSYNAQLCRQFQNSYVNLYIHQIDNGQSYKDLVNSSSQFSVSYKINNFDFDSQIKLNKVEIKAFKDLILKDNKVVSIQLQNDQSLLTTTFPVLISMTEDMANDAVLIIIIILLSCSLILLSMSIAFVCIKKRQKLTHSQ